ncbi:MAG: glycosyltransferase family 2 protein [Paludibacteraceae bacterium]|nr:glycosyltransferase family 2 protein [Paludibacteraceae bacterium]
MVKGQEVHIVMPVKDSLETAEEAIRAVVESGYTLTVYDDNSTPENAAQLDALRDELGIKVVHIGEHLNHPSPNYRWVLIDAQRESIENGLDLLIIESDVIVQKTTITSLLSRRKSRIGLIAAVTTDENGTINFPYEYARKINEDGICKKRLSFCCTLLTNEMLRAYDFNQLDERKNWYDVFISHLSQKMGFENILMISNPVIHKPHSSRPWKQLKYTHPLLYYWRKITRGMDKI